MLRFLVFLAACLLAPLAASADDFALGLPIACAPSRDCWIANYFDRDSTPGVKDVGCGARTYNGHDGTDFALRDLKAMEAGVDVVASASGRVKAVRDGEADVSVKIGGRQSVAGKECGNGVVLEHDGGWETQYCHMRRGSIVVRNGQEVAAGQKLGLVGLSGFTEFPHAHLTVRKGGVAVDPFDGHRADDICGVPGASPLWRPDLRAAVTYEPVVLIAAGLAGLVPSKEVAERGDLGAFALSPTMPVLAMWVRAMGIEAGDELTVRVVGPDGKAVFESTQKADKRQAAWFAFAARKRPADGLWPKGAYHGEAILARGGKAAVTRTIQAAGELR